MLPFWIYARKTPLYLSKKGSGIDIHKSILNSPFAKLFSTTPYGELHWKNITQGGKPDATCGIGTKRFRFNDDWTLKPWSQPTGAVDAECAVHDKDYFLAPETDDPLKAKQIADQKFIERLDNLKNLPAAENIKRHIIKKIIQAKLAFGGGLLGMGLADMLHKEYRKAKVFQKVKYFSKDDIWSADIIDLPHQYAGRLGLFKYALTVIDLYTRYGWVKPLRNKKGETVVNALKEIFKESGRRPDKLWVDNGKEFYNQHMYKLFRYKKDDVGQKDENGKYLNKIYSTFNDEKAMVAERFNKTIKNKLFKRFTEQGHQKWLKILPDVVKNYNNKVHSTIKVTPEYASKYPNDEKVRNTINNSVYYNEINLKQTKPKFELGQEVSIFLYKRTFDKGYKEKWSRKPYRIFKVIKGIPNVYRVWDIERDEEILGTFKENELQKYDY